MGATIAVYNDGRRMAVTNRAFSTVLHTELLRERTMNFSIVNTENARKYATDPNAVYEIEGQKYDVKKYDQESGTDNSTVITSYHVLLHAKNYTIPIGYSFVGTIEEIIQDILDVSGASAEFTIGECADISGSYSLNNTQATDAYSAIAMLTKLGVEPTYDNFIINAPVRWGSDTGKVFKFGRDLCSLTRHFDKTTTPLTCAYEISIANLQRLPGGSPSDTFVVGDTIGIQDDIIGDSIIGQRIITYDKCIDDPTQDKVTIGSFITDLSDTITAMQVDISTSVQQGDDYSNISITHKDGIKATLLDGTYAQMNGHGVKATHTNGDYTTLDGDGLLHHNGSDLTEYHYLSYQTVVEFEALSEGWGGYSVTSIQLPDQFKGKNFTVSVSIRQALTNWVPSAFGIISNLGTIAVITSYNDATVDIWGNFDAFDTTDQNIYSLNQYLTVNLIVIA